MARKGIYPPSQGEVTVTRNGRTHTANWGISSGMVSVWHPLLGSKSTQIGGHAAGGEEAIARLLFTELVDAEANKQ